MRVSSSKGKRKGVDVAPHEILCVTCSREGAAELASELQRARVTRKSQPYGMILLDINKDKKGWFVFLCIKLLLS